MCHSYYLYVKVILNGEDNLRVQVFIHGLIVDFSKQVLFSTSLFLNLEMTILIFKLL